MFFLFLVAFVLGACVPSMTILPQEGNELTLSIEGVGDETYIVITGDDGHDYKVNGALITWYYDRQETQQEYAIMHDNASVDIHLHADKDPANLPE